MLPLQMPFCMKKRMFLSNSEREMERPCHKQMSVHYFTLDGGFGKRERDFTLICGMTL